MDLKELIKIFKVHKNIFWGTILLALFIGVIYYLLQTDKYLVSLNLNIFRVQTSSMNDNKAQKNQVILEEKKSYYRLQADKEFIKNIKLWLSSPAIVEDILEHSKEMSVYNINSNKSLKNFFSIIDSSPQSIEINFLVKTKNSGKEISNAITDKINNLTEQLNKNNIEDTWFKVSSQTPYISLKKYSLVYILTTSLFFGVFLGFLIVMLYHYYKQDYSN